MKWKTRARKTISILLSAAFLLTAIQFPAAAFAEEEETVQPALEMNETLNEADVGSSLSEHVAHLLGDGLICN